MRGISWLYTKEDGTRIELDAESFSKAIDTLNLMGIIKVDVNKLERAPYLGFLIPLEHKTSKEKLYFDVEEVTEKYVAIRFGLAGLYELRFKDNVLVPYGTRPKTSDWECPELEKVKRAAIARVEGRDPRTELEESMARHEATMPGKQAG